MEIKITLIIAALAVLQCCSARDLSQEKLIKSYAKINKYLEKNVQSDDPKINMAKIKDLLEEKASKCTLLTGKSLVDTLKLLVKFSDNNPFEYGGCRYYKRNDLFDTVDSGLAEESRSKTPNFPLSRLDKVIQHYAFEDVLRCGATESLPKMKYGYKQIAYDSINHLLVDALPNVDDIDTNMAKAEELLKGMNPPDGALAEALKQFLDLKLTLNVDTCNERGYEILLRNNLATKREAALSYFTPLRRVSKIVLHYAKKHEQLCRPVVPGLVKSELKRLDVNTYRLVLGLVAAYFLGHQDYNKLAEDLNQKSVDEDFSTPLLFEYINGEYSRFTSRHSNNIGFHLERNPRLTDKDIYFYVKSVSTKDPLAKYLDIVTEEKLGRMVVDEYKLGRVLERYLFEPCGRFLNVFKGLMGADEYSLNMNSNHDNSYNEKFFEELSYHTVREGYLICERVTKGKQDVIDGVKDLSGAFRSGPEDEFYIK